MNFIRHHYQCQDIGRMLEIAFQPSLSEVLHFIGANIQFCCKLRHFDLFLKFEYSPLLGLSAADLELQIFFDTIISTDWDLLA